MLFANIFTDFLIKICLVQAKKSAKLWENPNERSVSYVQLDFFNE